jgi:RNA polymerase sigma factor (sigma-70 family)
MSALPASAPAPVRADGDRELERLYAEYARRVEGYCRRQLGGRAEAEDATQTVFLYALRALRSGVVPENESAWLFTIAHNVCRTYWRGAARRRRAEDQRDPYVLEQVVAQRESDHDELFGLEDALSRIPESQRRAVLLREWHGLSYREIAQTLGTSAAAVEMLLFRARRSLAAELRGERPTMRAKALGGLGHLLTGLKLLFGGAPATAKIAAAAAVVATLSAGGAELAHRNMTVATHPSVGRTAVSTPAASEPVGHAAARAQSRVTRGRAHGPSLSNPPVKEPAGPHRGAATPPAPMTGSAPAPPAAAGEASPSTPAPPDRAAPVAPTPTADAPASPPAAPPPPPPAPAADLPAPLPQLPETPPLPEVEAPALPPVTVPAVPDVPQVPDLPDLPQVSVPTPPSLP